MTASLLRSWSRRFAVACGLVYLAYILTPSVSPGLCPVLFGACPLVDAGTIVYAAIIALGVGWLFTRLILFPQFPKEAKARGASFVR